MPGALELVEAGQQNFTTPDTTIRTKTGSVKSQADQRILHLVLRHTGSDVGMMVLYF